MLFLMIISPLFLTCILASLSWKDLVTNSFEHATDQDYDLLQTWFDGIDDPSVDTQLQAPFDEATSINNAAHLQGLCILEL